MAEEKQGIVVSIDLGTLWTGDGDETVEDRILGIVARQLLESVDRDVRAGATQAVRDVRTAVIREQVKPIVKEALAKPLVETDRYGEEKRGGETITLTELIQAQVKKFTTVKASVHSSREGTELEQMVEQAVDRQFKTDLKKAVDAGKAAALRKVEEAAGEVIAETIRKAAS